MTSPQENLITLLDETTRQTTFQVTYPSKLLSPPQLRAEYDHRRLSQSLQMPIDPKANIPTDLLAILVQELHPILKPYMDSKEKYVGTGFFFIFGWSRITIENFAHILVGATAILGAERVVQLLFGWMEGERFQLQDKALLSGVTIDAPLALEEGIRIERLPSSSVNLPTYVPQWAAVFPNNLKFLSGVVLSADSTLGPVFYRPVDDKTWRGIEFTWGQGKMSGGSSGTFCEALSLACNYCIRQRVYWRDYGELSRFYLTAHSLFVECVEYGIPSSVVTIPLIQEDLERARDIYLERKAAEKTGLNLDVIIRRWIKSKQPETAFPDRLIELRIALENLLLKDNSGEKGFRLAIHGAWYLGCDPGERKEHFKTLREAYNLASKAIHTGDIKPDQNKYKENETLLTNAQDLCRDAILKRLREQCEPDWDKIIFGA